MNSPHFMTSWWTTFTQKTENHPWLLSAISWSQSSPLSTGTFCDREVLCETETALDESKWQHIFPNNWTSPVSFSSLGDCSNHFPKLMLRWSMLTDVSNIEIINPAISKLLLFCSAGQTLFLHRISEGIFSIKTSTPSMCRLKRVNRSNVFIQIVLKLTRIYIEFIWTWNWLFMSRNLNFGNWNPNSSPA